MKPESWTPPTLSDIRNFCAENGLYVDPERFYNYYRRSGFTYRGLPMDWRSKLKDWDRTEYKRSATAKPVEPSNPHAKYGSPEDFQSKLAILKRAIENKTI